MATGARFSLRADQWRAVANTMLQKLQEGDSSISKGIADIAIDGIVKRTRGGLDIAGVNFKPYSEAYAKKKKGARPNLVASGAMISREGFEFEVLKKENRIIIRIYVPSKSHGKVDQYTLASVHNFGMRSGRGMGFAMPKREFMGLDQKIIDAINEFTKEQWRDIFRGLK